MGVGVEEMTMSTTLSPMEEEKGNIVNDDDFVSV